MEDQGGELTLVRTTTLSLGARTPDQLRPRVEIEPTLISFRAFPRISSDIPAEYLAILSPHLSKDRMLSTRTMAVLMTSESQLV